MVDIRALTGAAVWGILSAEPVWQMARRRNVGRGITVFMYHELGHPADSADSWQVVRVTDFLRQVDFLRKHYRIISLDQAHREIVSGTGPQSPAVVLTFDDGHVGLIEYLAPIVRSEGIPVTLYLATEHIAAERPYWFDRIVNGVQSDRELIVNLTRVGLRSYRIRAQPGRARWSDIQALLSDVKVLGPERCEDVADTVVHQFAGNGRGAVLTPLKAADVTELSRMPLITIGAHSHGHEVMTVISEDLARESVRRGRALLAQWTGANARHFAYPAGFRNTAIEQLVCDEGFDTAMGTHPGIWTPHHRLHAIPRIGVGRYDSLNRFRANCVVGFERALSAT